MKESIFITIIATQMVFVAMVQYEDIQSKLPELKAAWDGAHPKHPEDPESILTNLE